MGCFQTIFSVLLISIISAAVCAQIQFLCGSGESIPWERLCDGLPQCQDGSDEGIDCVCGSDQWRCTSGQCIPADARCNTVENCHDSSDEMLCPDCTGFQCDTGLCLWDRDGRCNGVFDCFDLSDEMGCPDRARTRMCNNTATVHVSKWCNGLDDCGDNSDEADCRPACRGYRTSCSDGRCIMRRWWCDGYADCEDGSDEEGCGTCHPTDEFMCDNYQCVALSAVCDGVLDCQTEEDELNCFSLWEENSGSLWVWYKGQDYAVCSDEWSTDLAVQICTDIDQLQLAGWNEMAPSPSMTHFVAFNNNALSARTPNLAVRAYCESGKIINLTCHDNECGNRKVASLQSFVAGGEIVSPGKWPWMVSLLYLGKFICGGSLISESWVITAAHCILEANRESYNFSPTPFYFDVVLGSTHHLGQSRQGTPYRIQVSQIHLFPNLTRSWDWDVALLKLSVPVSYTDYIQPLCLPHQGQSISPASLCYLAGWGLMSPEQFLSPEDLRDTRMQLWSDTRCARSTIRGESAANANSTLCGGFSLGKPSICQGDSGGPLMCLALNGRWMLAGVVSRGSSPCGFYSDGQANRFARVANMVDWIRQQIAET